MSKADEMFKEAGYSKKKETGFIVSYYVPGNWNRIYFYKKIKKIDLTEKISVKALQAINLKVKELRLDRRRK